jgi:branched-chain amino acid transport system substrate-binding protein
MTMKNTPAVQMLTWLIASILGVASGHAETNHVVIGNIDDMSSVYADVSGQSGEGVDDKAVRL